MCNGSLGDYLVPMAGAPAVVMNAINDALAPFKARLASQPITPQKILRALGKVAG